jgi:hypothetical protein
MNRLLPALLLAAGFTSAAIGQLVTPPTPAPKASEPFVMPPVPPPVAPAQTPDKGADFTPPANLPPPGPAPLPDLPYQPIGKSPEGKMIPLAEPMEYAALRANPMVKEEQRAKLAAALAWRRERYESVVITNLDLVEKFEGGVLDTLNITDRQELSKALALLKPIIPPAAPPTLMQELLKADLITNDQKRFNEKITKEYIEAMQKEAKANETDKGAQASLALLTMLRSAIDEPIHVRRELIAELARSGAGLESPLASKAQAALSAVAANDTPAQKAKAIDKALASMTVEQRRAALETMVKARKK